MTRRRAAAFAALSACVAAAGGATAADARRSGFDEMSPALQAMQRDDAQNPGMLWVRDGEAAWSRPAGPQGKACATCHGAAERSMRGVAARYPAFDALEARPVDLAGRIRACQSRHQGTAPAAWDSDALLALEAFVAHQSRGQPIAPVADPRLAAARERGRALYAQRIGQLDLSCAQCHDARAGGRLGGSTIPQAHPTAYPIYRLEWQAAGSLQRRLRNCMTGVRAEPYAYGAAELVELELHLKARAAGMTIETPGVRP